MEIAEFLEYNEDTCGMQLKQYFESKFIILNVFIKINLLKDMRLKINDLSVQLQKLEKESTQEKKKENNRN